MVRMTERDISRLIWQAGSLVVAACNLEVRSQRYRSQGRTGLKIAKAISGEADFLRDEAYRLRSEADAGRLALQEDSK